MSLATGRRLRDELNIDTTLEYVFKFSYHAEFGTLGSEHELCHVYLGRIDTPVTANEHEIAAVRFVAADRLAREFEQTPELFTPWFVLEWQRLANDHRDALERHTALVRARPS
jgi:isopentenyl-diphosphate delta-isomerase